MWNPASIHTKLQPDHAGFTLIELLIALALLGLIAVLLYSTFQVGTDIWSRAEARFARMEANLAGQRILRQLIGLAYPHYERASDGRGAVAFEGTTERLKFFAPLPAALGGGEMAEMTLSVVSSGEVRKLVLTWSRESSMSHLEMQTLVDEIAAAEFTYFGQIAGETTPAWHSNWEREPRLPDLVRIRIQNEGMSATTWPELILRPQIDVDVGCVYDPVSRGCYGR